MDVFTTILDLVAIGLLIACIVGLAFMFWPAAAGVASISLLATSYVITRSRPKK